MSDQRKIQKSEEQWRQELTPEQYRILRQAGTEPPFQNAFNDHHEDGVYQCAGCGTPLFDSQTKYSSGSGWPSFYEPLDPNGIEEVDDNSLWMRRVEVRCAACEGHLGHVFPDGPRPTGMRYCINSGALSFRGREE